MFTRSCVYKYNIIYYSYDKFNILIMPDNFICIINFLIELLVQYNLYHTI
jgi:hypothetical protein